MPMLIDLNVLIMNETLSIEYQSQYETGVIMQSARIKKMAITYIEILQIYRSHEDKPANRKK